MKKISILVLVGLIGASLWMSSCSLIFGINGSGEMETETRNLDSFHSVVFVIPGKINLTYDNSQSVSLTADDNILEHIETKVTNGVLVVQNKEGSWLGFYTMTLNLAMTDLKYLSIIGTGDIETKNQFSVTRSKINITGTGNATLNIVATEFEAEMIGTGSLGIQGSADKMTVILSGTGSVNGYDFTLKTNDIITSGTGSVYTTVSGYLKVVISGTGSVFYKGNPTVDISVSGTGSLVNKN